MPLNLLSFFFFEENVTDSCNSKIQEMFVLGYEKQKCKKRKLTEKKSGGIKRKLLKKAV